VADPKTGHHSEWIAADGTSNALLTCQDSIEFYDIQESTIQSTLGDHLVRQKSTESVENPEKVSEMNAKRYLNDLIDPALRTHPLRLEPIHPDQEMPMETLSTIEPPRFHDNDLDVTFLNFTLNVGNGFQKTAVSNSELTKNEVTEALKADPTLQGISDKVVQLSAFMTNTLGDLKGTINTALAEGRDQPKSCKIRTTHLGVACSNCKSTSIVGKRFRCLTCPNFNLCERCESTGPVHAHPMLRLNERVDDIVITNAIKSAHLMQLINSDFKMEELQLRALRHIIGGNYSPECYDSIIRQANSQGLLDFIEKMRKVFE